MDKISKLALSTFLLFFFSIFILVHPADAYKKVATYDLKNKTGGGYSIGQGATMTEKYLIYTDWNNAGAYKTGTIWKGGTTVLVICTRDSQGNPTSNCKRSSDRKYNHANYLFHIWGTDYFAVESAGDYVCLSISELLKEMTVVYKGFPGGSDSKESACNARDSSLIPGLGRSLGKGNGNPL